MGGLLVGQQKQEIDVGIGGQLAAAIAADRDNGQLLTFCRVGEPIDPLGDEIVESPDQLIDQETLLPHRARRMPLRLETALDLGPALRQRLLQRRQQRAAIERRSHGSHRLRQLVRERPPVDNVALAVDIRHQPLRGAARHRPR